MAQNYKRSTATKAQEGRKATQKARGTGSKRV